MFSDNALDYGDVDKGIAVNTKPPLMEILPRFVPVVEVIGGILVLIITLGWGCVRARTLRGASIPPVFANGFANVLDRARHPLTGFYRWTGTNIRARDASRCL